MYGITITRRSAAVAAAVLAAPLAAMLLSGSPSRFVRVAEASPVPVSISEDSSVSDVLRFAEASGSHWKTLSAQGRTRSGASAKDFKVWASRSGRSRAEEGDEVRVRNGRERLNADRRTGAARRFSVARATPAAEQALKDRTAAHRAQDPTLMREGEMVVDTPLNNLLSPSYLVRKELGLTATSVRKTGVATVAGRRAIVLEARFPAELAKEDHWDVYVDMETGVLLGLVIEPLAGGERYETFVDSLTVDPVLPDRLFDCAAAQGSAP